jgi:hypothetical protein
VGPHHVGGGLRIARLQRREQLLMQQSVGGGRDVVDLARHDDVALRPSRYGVSVLDQDLIVRAAVDHPVKRPVDIQHAADRHGKPGVSQVAECFLLVLASDQLSRLGEFPRRYLLGREPRREKVEFPSDCD